MKPCFADILLADILLAEISEMCPQHEVFRQGDCVTACSGEFGHKLSGAIYPYDEEIVLHCHNHLIGQRLYLVVDIQHPTGTDTLLKLFKDHLDGRLVDADYNGT